MALSGNEIDCRRRCLVVTGHVTGGHRLLLSRRRFVTSREREMDMTAINNGGYEEIGVYRLVIGYQAS